MQQVLKPHTYGCDLEKKENFEQFDGHVGEGATGEVEVMGKCGAKNRGWQTLQKE